MDGVWGLFFLKRSVVCCDRRGDTDYECLAGVSCRYKAPVYPYDGAADRHIGLCKCISGELQKYVPNGTAGFS